MMALANLIWPHPVGTSGSRCDILYSSRAQVVHSVPLLDRCDTMRRLVPALKFSDAPMHSTVKIPAIR